MPSTSIGDELLKQGVLGIVVLLLIYAIIVLWRKLAERDATIAALQESRLQATVKTTEALVNASTAMNNAAEANGQMNESLRAIVTEYSLRSSRGRP
jgi:hypothetical protein